MQLRLFDVSRVFAEPIGDGSSLSAPGESFLDGVMDSQASPRSEDRFDLDLRKCCHADPGQAN